MTQIKTGWIKTRFLKSGMEIATFGKDGLSWQRIKSVKRVRLEKVYDLQIANTHNFVGNGIVAHNTYINSASTTANVKGLEIAQSGAISGTGYGLYATKTGASTTNVGGYFSASGATNNYGLIVENGNVGIGTVGPTSKLGVLGNLAVGGTYGALAAPTSGAIIEGNVGVGTTNPLANLHVVGECVVGNTLLPIKRKKKNKLGVRSYGLGGGDGDDSEFDNLLIPIKDVLPGDLVASLDEEKGTIVYKPIRKLLNKGWQKVVKITTKSGRVIETTLNHPYLTQKTGWKKVFQLTVGAKIAITEKPIWQPTFAFIDASNLMYAANRVGWKMDFEKLASYLKYRFGVDRLLFFGGVDSANKKQAINSEAVFKI